VNFDAHDHTADGRSRSRKDQLLTPRFALVVSSGLCYFLALAMLTPVIPHYVKDRLHYGDAAVGVAVGAFAVGAIVLRTYAGRIGDTVGRRALIISGALIVAVSTIFYGAIEALWWLITMRVITGFGEAAFFVGAATMITDLAPVNRRGEAVSYWSVAVYGGLSFGPALGDFLRGDDRYALTFVVSASLALFAAALGWFTRDVPREHDVTPGGRLWHPAALRPGFVLFLGLMPLSAFTPLLPLYVDSDVDASAGAVFLLYGILILVVRIVGARLPDRLGGRHAGALALAFSGTGILIIAVWGTIAGLLLGTMVFASGMSLLYPALLVLALGGIKDSERASVVGTFSSFFDLSSGFGAAIAGVIAEIAGYRGAFAVAGGTCLAGLLLLRNSVAAPVEP
jgi:MFS family permease